MKRLALLLTGVAVLFRSARIDAALAKEAAVEKRTEYVVMIHGLGRTGASMKRLQWSLEKEGYRVINSSYPSRRLSVQAAANNWLRELLKSRIPDGCTKVHFVTHSLGALVLREYLKEHPMPNAGRAVMIAPPNKGSELADLLESNRLFKALTGPAGQQLGTGAMSLPKQLGPARIDLGVIAGDRSCNPLSSVWIAGRHDGKVSVQNARLEGMKDFLVVHRTHTWIMWDKKVNRAVARFLETGRFAQDPGM